jgi:hypothetical protein
MVKTVWRLEPILFVKKVPSRIGEIRDLLILQRPFATVEEQPALVAQVVVVDDKPVFIVRKKHLGVPLVSEEKMALAWVCGGNEPDLVGPVALEVVLNKDIVPRRVIGGSHLIEEGSSVSGVKCSGGQK